ncbi:MAG: TetR/AcrR family transcriptional regulator [Paracoccus denitrificans]|uniref:TetR/AcrR family transcriptional regulator n=1 Tax=Paracoccus denitrificans TaxID=266 RepID=A0A533ICJ7_PARDE|nr:MAG: TetR/AcrR family transcriptional regulator [Paracoccus denitrificans]
MSDPDDQPPRKPTRTRRSRDELRQLTLDAARQIILEEGPEALTARRLAKAVGYTPGTIYNLFDSLPDVLWQVNRAHFARIASLFSNLPGVTPQDRLRALAARYLDLVEAEPTLFRALFEGPRKSEEFPDWYMRAIDGLLDLTATELTSLAPDMPASVARRDASALFASIQGLAQLRAGGRLDLLTDASAKELADALIVRVLRDVEHQQS